MGYRTNRVLQNSISALQVDLNTTQVSLDYSGWKCLEKSDGAVLAGTDDLFTITGGPIYARIFGIVTTIIGGAANGTLEITTTTPSATVAISTTVAVDNDAAGTLYTFTTVAAGTVPVLTPTTNGIGWYDPATATKLSAEFFLPPGTLKFLGSGAQTGNIKWYLSYLPLSTNSVVTVAA